MSVRTDETKFINRALTLASSRCPKLGSDAPAVQPTMHLVSMARYTNVMRGEAVVALDV